MKKTEKNTAYDGCGLRPHVLFFRPVPENKFSHNPQVPHGFVPKFQNSAATAEKT